jgi:hypothetical protein
VISPLHELLPLLPLPLLPLPLSPLDELLGVPELDPLPLSSLEHAATPQTMMMTLAASSKVFAIFFMGCFSKGVKRRTNADGARAHAGLAMSRAKIWT